MTISTIEEKYLNHIGGLLPFFSKQLNACRLQCPYCQLGSKDHKGRPMTASRCKGFFYSNGNALNYKCHRCGIGKQFHTFLEDHFPLIFFDYVAEREGLGLTGKGTMLLPSPMLLRGSQDGLRDLLQRQMREWRVRDRKLLAAATKMLLRAIRISRFQHHLNRSSPNCPD